MSLKFHARAPFLFMMTAAALTPSHLWSRARRSRVLVALASACGIAAVGVVDEWTGAELRIYPLYFVPLAFAAWQLPERLVGVLAILAAFTCIVAEIASGRVHSQPYIFGINFITQIVAFGVVGGLVAQLRAKMLAERALSRRDPLTQLSNARAFHEQAQLLFALHHRTKRPLTLAYVDLDSFKIVNDKHGHQAGDAALVSVARCLQRELRSSDLVARIGGDEFAVVLPDTTSDQARAALERMRIAIETAMRAHGWPITASIGALSFVRVSCSLGEALHQTDALMYRSKGAGKNCVHVEEHALLRAA